MTNFKVGQKVVCIDSFEGRQMMNMRPLIGPAPEKDGIYTFDGYRHSISGTGVFLKEFDYMAYGHRVSFVEYKFRPLQYESASSEILAKLPLTEERSDVEIKELEIA